jgi:hypothetical protein
MSEKEFVQKFVQGRPEAAALYKGSMLLSWDFSLKLMVKRFSFKPVVFFPLDRYSRVGPWLRFWNVKFISFLSCSSKVCMWVSPWPQRLWQAGCMSMVYHLRKHIICWTFTTHLHSLNQAWLHGCASDSAKF